jgi:hypothetical protein
MRAGRLVVAVAAIGCCVAAPASAATPGADRIVLQRYDVPGLKASHASVGAARRTVGRLVAHRRARVEAAAYHRGRGAAAIRLTVEAYAFGSERLAGRALGRWRRLSGGGRRFTLRRVRRLGQGGFAGSRTRHGRTVAVVGLRQSGALAVVQLELRASGPIARRLALSYAALEAARLRGALARTAWDRVLARVGRNGTASRTALLQLFSLAYGHIPGVRLPAGSRHVPPVSGSWFVQQILQDQWSHLTRAQRRAVSRALWPPRGRGRARARAAAGVLDGCLDQVGGLTLDVAATDDARQVRAAEQTHMPYATTNFEVCAYVAPKGGDTLANTIAWYRNRSDAPNDGNQSYGSFPDECFIRLYDGWRGLTLSHRRTILAHETYHCIHAEWWQRQAWFGGTKVANPPWVEEGLATWAGNEVAPGPYQPEAEPPGLYYKVWLDHYQQLPLFQQSYEPFGFWGLVSQEASVGALWTRIFDIWKAGPDSSQVFDVATSAQRGLVLDHWGPGVFSQPSWPGGWQQQLPYAVTNPISVDAVVPVSGTVQVATQPYADLKVQIDNTAQRLVEVFVDGHGSLTDGSKDIHDPHNAWLCLGGHCTCPPGEHASTPIPPHTDTGPLVYAGLAGDEFPTRLTLGGHDLSEYCTADAHRGGGGGGGGPPGGGSNGDPHLRSFDGDRYEFQAAGEFVLTRSTLGGFEVQARQQPITDSFFKGFLSVNTRLAFRVGHARVTFSMGDPLVVRVRGRAVHPERSPVSLPGGGSVHTTSLSDPCSGLDVRWPDGSLACVWGVGDAGVALWLLPAARHRGHLVGLLGNFNGTTADDFRTRSGRVFPLQDIAGALKTQFRNRYRIFGESWRVHQRESLFDYRRGQSTATFTNRRFPKASFLIDRLPKPLRARAEAVCQAEGIVDPAVFEACVIDYAATRNQAFADTAKTEEQASAISTPWQQLSGLDHEVAGPASIAATSDGTLHVAIMAEPTNDRGKPGFYLETSLDAADRQGPVSTDQPATQLQYAPLLTAGAGGLRLLGYVDVWPGTQPAGTSARGAMVWQNGAVSNWLPGAIGSATTYAETADGTPYTTTHAINNQNLWRGSGATAVHHEPALGPGCFDSGDSVVSDGSAVWFAWFEFFCADPSQNGIYVAQVSTTTGEIGAPQQVPRPGGASFASDYDGTVPLAFLHRPGTSGAWLAYVLLAHGVRHAFLYHTGDAGATDVGPVTGTRLLAAATPSGRLWLGWFDNNTPRGSWLLRLRRLAAGTNAAEPGAWTVSLPALASGAQASPDEVHGLARDERLDLVADFEAGFQGGPGAVWHTRVG